MYSETVKSFSADQSLSPMSESLRTRLCDSLKAVMSIIRALFDLLTFCDSTDKGGKSPYGDQQQHFKSLLLLSSKASLHLLLSRHILNKDGDDVAAAALRSVSDNLRSEVCKYLYQ